MTTNNTQFNTIMDLPFFTHDDAELTLETWICNIKLAHEINKWDVQTTARFAVARMRGRAGKKAPKLMDARFETLDALFDELRALFRDKSDSAQRLREAYQNGQRPLESIEDWGTRVREIIEDNMGRPFQEKQAIQLFTDMLRDGNISLQINIQEPTTLKMAIKCAEQYARLRQRAFSGKPQSDTPAESAFRTGHATEPEPMEIDQISRRADYNQASARDYNRTNARENGPSRFNARRQGRGAPAGQQQSNGRRMDCFYCGAAEHRIRDCPLRKEHEEYAREARLNISDLRRRRDRRSRGRKPTNTGYKAGRVQEMCDIMERLNILQEEEAASLDEDSAEEDLPEDDNAENQAKDEKDFQ